MALLSTSWSSVLFYSRILLSIRETGGDWADGQHGRGDPILKGEKDPKAGPNIKIPHRDIGPSSTQVEIWYQFGTADHLTQGYIVKLDVSV